MVPLHLSLRSSLSIHYEVQQDKARGGTFLLPDCYRTGRHRTSQDDKAQGRKPHRTALRDTGRF